MCSDHETDSYSNHFRDNMYQHRQQQHQTNNLQPCSRMFMAPERHLFLQGGNAPRDSGLVLSTDAKPRLKWTPDLHERFIEAVNQLGGADSKCKHCKFSLKLPCVF